MGLEMATLIESDVKEIAESNISRSSEFRNFTLFTYLPVEIRLKIWRMTFPPPRRVELGVVYIPKPRLARPPLPPVSLFVNRESRSETQRYYDTVYYNQEVFGSSPSRSSVTMNWVTFICAEKDTLVINGKLTWFHSYHTHDAITQLAAQLKRGLASIRRVEFTIFRWFLAFCPRIEGLEENRISIWGMLPRFEGMRTLEFLISDNGPFSNLAQCKEAVDTFLGLRRSWFVDQIVPKVTFVETSDSPTLLQSSNQAGDDHW